MRKITIAEHISLDGFVEPLGPDDTPSPHADWTGPYRTPEGAAKLAAAYGTGYDLLLGRRTYDQWSTYWPNMNGGPFADNLNAATKYIATHHPETLAWGPLGDLGPDPIKGIRELKTLEGPHLIVCGSTTLTRVLIDEGLVDELLLTVYPVLLGRGKRPFPETADLRKFTLISSQATPSGVLRNIYHKVELP